MIETIFTLGYEKRSIQEYVRLLRAAGINVLVDVRETAWSHKPGFSKSALVAALAAAGIEYVHASYAGNPKWLRTAAESHAECLEWYGWYLDEFSEIVDTFEAEVGDLLGDGRRVALTCFERHARDCHRSLLAERWAVRQRGRRVEHLAIGGCARLTKR